MVPSLFLATIIAQSASAPPEPMMQPQPVVDQLRLALTPVMDGVVSDQEWDLLTETGHGPTFFQWEPGAVYWAAKPEPGFDVVLSLDLKGDGWLVGNDNFELRSSLEANVVRVSVRQVDATDRNGPKWVEPQVLEQSIAVSGKPSFEYWNLEGKFSPVIEGLEPALDSKVGVRIDVVPSETETGPAYMPRGLSFQRLRFDKSRGLFSGLTWRPDTKTRSVARQDPFQFKFRFELDADCPSLQAVDVTGEGIARDIVKQVTLPFPNVDPKGNGLVVYESNVAAASISGYRVLRASVLAADGRIALIRTSFRVADIIDIDPNLPKAIDFSDEAQTVKSHVWLKSQALDRVTGQFTMRLPKDWKIVKGESVNLLIYHSKGTQKVPVEFQVPAGTRGVFPVQYSVDLGDTTINRTTYVSVR